MKFKAKHRYKVRGNDPGPGEVRDDNADKLRALLRETLEKRIDYWLGEWDRLADLSGNKTHHVHEHLPESFAEIWEGYRARHAAANAPEALVDSFRGLFHIGGLDAVKLLESGERVTIRNLFENQYVAEAWQRLLEETMAASPKWQRIGFRLVFYCGVLAVLQLLKRGVALTDIAEQVIAFGETI